MSFRYGDQWWGFKSVEPLSTTLGPTITIAEAMANPDKVEGMSALWGSLKDLVQNKTFMQGISMLMKAFEDESMALGAAENMGAAFVPNIIRGTARAADPNFQDLKNYEQGVERSVQAARNMFYKSHPYLAKDLVPTRVNYRGETSRKKDTFVERLFSPVNRQPVEEMDDYIRMLINYNSGLPDKDRRYIPNVDRRHFTMTINGEEVLMSPEERQRFLEIRNSFAHERASRMFRGKRVENPREQDIKRLRDLYSTGGKIAKRKIMAERRRSLTRRD